MDKIEEAEWTSLFGNWQAKLWNPNVFIGLCLNSPGNFQGDNLDI